MYLGDLFAGALGLSTHQQSLRLSQSSDCSSAGLSCPSTTPSNPDTCCLNHPSGHFLLTQFWDASPPLGSSENWTIHGLWPDFCAGGFDQFCDRNREHSDIAGILASSAELISYMNQHWLSLNGDNNHLWSHEWNKHGTCISTLEPDCYASAKDSTEAVTSYFTHAATLYSGLSTYATLAAAEILPSSDKQYALEELQIAITSSHGFPVTFRCHGSELQEIWYHYSTHGPLRHAQPFHNVTSSHSTSKDIFIPTKPDISKSNCPSSGIRYLPKGSRAPQPTHTQPAHTSTHKSEPTAPAGEPFSGRGHLIVRQISVPNERQVGHADILEDSAQQPFNLHPKHHSPSSISTTVTKGCLIRGGLWYTSGGCATYLAKTDPPHFATDEDHEHMFTLSSLYAPCAIVGGDAMFACAKDLGVQAIFESVNVTRLADGADALELHEGASGDSSEDNRVGSHTKERTVTREVLAWRGKTTFYADSIPGRFEKIKIFADDNAGTRDVAIEIEWNAI